jgi:hypothetical protein
VTDETKKLRALTPEEYAAMDAANPLPWPCEAMARLGDLADNHWLGGFIFYPVFIVVLLGVFVIAAVFAGIWTQLIELTCWVGAGYVAIAGLIRWLRGRR